MILLCDSREQLNKTKGSGLLTFEHEAIEWCQLCTLPFGDYWAVFKNGETSRYIIERKALGDFFGSFGGNYANEKNKLERFFENDLGITQYIVAIEGSVSDVLNGYKHSKKEGKDLFRTMMTWYVRYHVDVWMMSRKELEFVIPELFYAEGMNNVNSKLMKKKEI